MSSSVTIDYPKQVCQGVYEHVSVCVHMCVCVCVCVCMLVKWQCPARTRDHAASGGAGSPPLARSETNLFSFFWALICSDCEFAGTSSLWAAAGRWLRGR